MGFFRDLLFGGKPRTEPTQVSTLSSPQQAVEEVTGGFLAPRIGQGLPGFPDFTDRLRPVVTPTGLERTGLTRLGDFLEQQSPLFGAQTSEALTRLLGGETPDLFSPEQLTSLFERGVRGPAIHRFQEETLPSIRESFIGSGNFFGTERAEAERRGRRNLEEQLGGQEAQLQLAGQEKQADLRSQALDRIFKSLTIAPTISRSLQAFPLEQAQAALSMGPLERQLAGQGLEAELNEFVRTTPELSPVIQDAINLLRRPTTATGFAETPGTTGLLGSGGEFGLGTAFSTINSLRDLASGARGGSPFSFALPRGGTAPIGIDEAAQLAQQGFGGSVVPSRGGHIAQQLLQIGAQLLPVILAAT